MNRALYKKFAATGVLKLISILAVFLVASTLARMLGAEGYGIYSYVYVIISLLSIATNFGAPRFAMRETARALKSEDWPRMRQVWRWTTELVIGVSFALISLIAIAIWLFSKQIGPVYVQTLWAGLALLPLLALGALRGSFLRGLGYVVIGQLPEFSLRPIVFLVLIAAYYTLGHQMNAPSAMVLYAVAAAISFVAGLVLLRRRLPEGLIDAETPEVRQSGWLSAVLAMGLSSAMVQLNTYADILILGIFQPVTEVGIYRVSTQVALLSSVGLQAVTIVAAPLFAASLLSQDSNQTQRIATLSATVAFAIALPSVAIFFVFGEDLLRAIFGLDFVLAYSVIMLLMTGQLFSAFFGPTPQLHTMGGREKYVARILMYSTGANIALNLVLIPNLGMFGASCSTVVTMCAWNLTLWWSARSKLGVNCAPFPIFKK